MLNSMEPLTDIWMCFNCASPTIRHIFKHRPMGSTVYTEMIRRKQHSIANNINGGSGCSMIGWNPPFLSIALQIAWKWANNELDCYPFKQFWIRRPWICPLNGKCSMILRKSLNFKIVATVTEINLRAVRTFV